MVDQSPLKNDAWQHYVQALHKDHNREWEKIIRAHEDLTRVVKKETLIWKRVAIVWGVIFVVVHVAEGVRFWITW